MVTIECIGYVKWKRQKKQKKKTVCPYGYDMCTLKSKKPSAMVNIIYIYIYIYIYIKVLKN